MGTSTAQVLATVLVWDYVLASGDPSSSTPAGIPRRRVRVSLDFSQASSQSPVTALDTAPVTTQTDRNGFWQVNVVPTDQINPSGVLYLVEVDGRPPYLVNPVAAAVPVGGWQSSAILVNTPPGIGVSGFGLPGGTVVNGALTAKGAFVANSGTFVPLNSPYAQDFPGIGGNPVTTGVSAAIYDKGGQVWNIRNPKYGLAVDASTNDQAALKALLDTVAAAGGGVIFHPGGACFLGATIVGDTYQGIIFEGTSGATNGGQIGSRYLFTQGAGSDGFSFQRSAGIEFRRCQVMYNNASFNGKLLNFDGTVGTNTAFPALFDSYIGGILAQGVSAVANVSLAFANEAVISHCNIVNSVVGVKGRSVLADSNNGVVICHTRFGGNSTAHIQNIGSGVIGPANIFEPLASGAPGAYQETFEDTSDGTALVILGNWMSDITASPGVQLDIQRRGSFMVTGNFIGFGNSTTGVRLRSTGATGGFEIAGNMFQGGGTSDIGIDLSGMSGNNSSFRIAPNKYNSIATPISGAVPSWQDQRSMTSPFIYLLNSSAADGRTVIQMRAVRTSTKDYSFGIDPDGSANKSWAIRDLTAAGTPLRWGIDTLGHMFLNSAGAAPASSNLGANVTSVTPTGNDSRGKLVIVMSGALAANTRIATISYNGTYLATPVVLVVNMTSGAGLAIVNFYVGAEGATSFDLFSDQALAAGTYECRYWVVG